jgi:hypothetical protein
MTALKHFLVFSAVGLLIPMIGLAQQDTLFVPGDRPPAEGGLNRAIDSVIATGKLPTTVFRLEPWGFYVLTGNITVPAGQKLTIIPPEPGKTQVTGPPQILWTATDPFTAYNIICRGNITLKNVWLLFADAAGQ